MKTLSVLFVAGAASIFLSGCTSESQIASVLEKNPDILFKAIEKNPEKFIESATKASMEARKNEHAKNEQKEQADREEEFKNPKNPEIAGRASRGEESAPLLLVEYSDFQCPYCRVGYQNVDKLQEKYGKKLKFVYKHLPLGNHPLARPAAQYFEAIAMQSAAKAYEFHDHVFEHQSDLVKNGEKFLEATAKKVGANMARLKTDMNSETVKNRIAADEEEAKKFGIQGTPGFVVAGVTIKGAYPVEHFVAILDRKLGEREVSQKK